MAELQAGSTMNGELLLTESNLVSNPGIWTETDKIQASVPEANAWFGVSTAISNDGLTCIVGSYTENNGGTNRGAAYVYEFTGTWVETQKLQPSVSQDFSLFGRASSLSSDGLTCLITADGIEAAYIFEKQNGTWVETAKLEASDKEANDTFGFTGSISSDGLICIIGAFGEDTGGSSAGAAYIFENQSGTWVEVQKIQPTDVQAGDSFGYSVDTNKDGSVCIVSSQLRDGIGSDRGAAYIFEKQSNTWVQTQILEASDAADSDHFGKTVSITDNGLTCVISATGQEDIGFSQTGAVYVFENQDGVWVETHKLYSSDINDGDTLGNSLNISNDGSMFIVGTINEASGGTAVGAAYIFKKYNQNWVEEIKLQASDKQSNDNFGVSVAISSDSLTCIVGAAREDSNGTDAGSVYLFERY